MDKKEKEKEEKEKEKEENEDDDEENEKEVKGKGKIYFYSHNKKNGFLSNFYKCEKLVIGGKFYKTTEHYYQSKKFEGTKYEEEIRNAKSAFQAKKMGGTKKQPLRKDWEKVKEDVMYKACIEKFKQNPGLKKKLLATGNKKLYEHTSNDTYRADGGDKKKGKNRLGFILEKVRKNLKDEK